MNITYFGHSAKMRGAAWHPHSLPTNKHSHSGHHTNKDKHAYTATVKSQRLNYSRFDDQFRVQSPSKCCRDLNSHHNKSSIPSDVHNLKSFITSHAFSRTYPCRYSKCCWERQLSWCLIHSVPFHSQIIPALSNNFSLQNNGIGMSMSYIIYSRCISMDWLYGCWPKHSVHLLPRSRESFECMIIYNHHIVCWIRLGLVFQSERMCREGSSAWGRMWGCKNSPQQLHIRPDGFSRIVRMLLAVIEE